jgi:HPt (histidine-containing phosphotransfer) domain-containing protein
MLAAPVSGSMYPALAERFAALSLATPQQTTRVLNQQELWQHLDHDVALLQELTALFVHHYPLYLHTIRHAIRQHDSAALVMGALTVKGMVGNLRAIEALQVVSYLEELGQQGEFRQAARTALLLDRTLARLAQALGRLCHPVEGREDCDA